MRSRAPGNNGKSLKTVHERERGWGVRKEPILKKEGMDDAMRNSWNCPQAIDYEW